MKKATTNIKNLISFSALTKAGISALANSAVNSVLETGNPLQVAESLAAMENFIKAVRDNEKFTDYVREEIKKHGKLFTSASGAKLEIAETGTKYNYENTGDAEIPALTESKKEIEKKIKAREDFLKALPDRGLDIVNDATGEVITLYKPFKTSNSSYKVTLAVS